MLDARAEPYAAVPTIMLRLRIAETDGRAGARGRAAVPDPHRAAAAPLRPRRRGRLVELFGEPPQWGDSLRPFLWTHVATMVTGFTGCTEVDLPVTCTYDFEVAGTKYLHALDDGEIPLLLLFSGTRVRAGATPASRSAPVAWHEEASFRLPVRVWRDVMDLYFPNSRLAPLSRDTLDALTRFKAARALPTWDQVVRAAAQGSRATRT